MSFPTSRDNYSRSPDGFVSWYKERMTRGIRALEDRAEEIAQIGKEAVQGDIEAFDRIADPHRLSDGEESMIEGVRTSINQSRTEGEMSIRVGWDLTEYRDGYPELQDKGFTNLGGGKIQGMQALSVGRMAMIEAAKKIVDETK